MATKTVTKAYMTKRLEAAITRGGAASYWGGVWTRAQYGVATEAEITIRAYDIPLEHANEVLVAKGYEPLGPDLKTYTWGEIVAIHRIGEDYAIIESLRDGKDGVGEGTYFSDYVRNVIEPEDGFYCTSHSHHSLDSALLHAIVFAAEWRRDGLNAALNERLTRYIGRMLELGS